MLPVSIEALGGLKSPQSMNNAYLERRLVVKAVLFPKDLQYTWQVVTIVPKTNWYISNPHLLLGRAIIPWNTLVPGLGGVDAKRRVFLNM